MSLPLIRTDFPRVSADLVAAAKQFPASILADVGGRRGTLDGAIAPLSKKFRLAGPAFPVEVRHGDNLMIHAAIALAQPGDVIIVDGKGDTTCALTGEIMATHAKLRGVAGFVIDAATRDTAEVAEGDFPVFSRGANPNGPTKAQPGRIGWPISIGGCMVNPGDLVVGDADGVTIIPRENAAAIIGAAQAKVDAETKRFKDMAAGDLGAPQWLIDGLEHTGVLKKGETL